MRASELPAIRELDLFRPATDAHFQRLMQAAYLQSFPAQVELIAEGDAPDFLFVVVEGQVELYCATNGHESTLSMLAPCATFVLAAVVRDAPYLMSARTSVKSRLLMIPSSDVRIVFHSDEGFARAVVDELACNYRSVVKELKNQKLRSGIARLANQLLRYEQEQGGTGEITLPHDKKTLASLLGMTPENLSRAFNTLQPYGVTVAGSRVRLRNLDDLERLAKPDPLIDDPAL